MTYGAILGTYIIIQLWANTMGLIVIFVLDGIIEEALKSRGYERLPLTMSDKTKAFVAGVIKFNIPMYYCITSINLVSNNLNSIINERLKNGQYIMIIENPKQKVERPKEVIKEIPKIEPLPMVQEHYKATSRASLYTAKPVNMSNLEYTGEVEKPELSKIIPFAPKTTEQNAYNNINNSEHNEYEQDEYTNNSNNVLPFKKIGNTNYNSASYVYDKKDVA